MSAQTITNSVINNYKANLSEFHQTHKETISSLSILVVPFMNTGVIDEIFWDHIDELKGSLGAEAANQCSDDENMQEEAIDLCEAWVADNVSNASTDTWITSYLMDTGITEGEQSLRRVIGSQTN